MTEHHRESWEEWFMGLAHHVAGRSRDPSTKVGAIIVRPDSTQASFGYNDFPRGVAHTRERYENRDFKYAAIVHAEANAILNARESLSGHRLYSTFHPCARCAALVVQSGIKSVVYDDSTPLPDRWRADMDIAATILTEGHVALYPLSKFMAPLRCEAA
jgi:dCMP deaminase